MKYLKMYESFSNDSVNEGQVSKLTLYYIGPFGMDSPAHLKAYLKSHHEDCICTYVNSGDANRDTLTLNAEMGQQGQNYCYKITVAGMFVGAGEIESVFSEMGTDEYEVVDTLQLQGQKLEKTNLVKDIKSAVPGIQGFETTIASYSNNQDIPAYFIFDFNSIKEVKRFFVPDTRFS